MGAPRLSVVVPTYNRRERLSRVLSALGQQEAAAGSFEVVVVDDGSTDGTSEWLATLQTPYALRTLRVPNGGPARARNAGVAAAQGEIVLFIDDDVEPTPTLVSEHLRCHDAEQDVVVIGPLASLPHYAQPWVAWEQRMVESQYEAMARGDWAPTFRQFWTGNASVARAHVLGAGGFDATYLRAEDIELGMRLRERGLRFRFNAAARGLHHAERSLDSWENVHKSYGRLEVEIFGQASQGELLEVLSGNWNRLHPATRWLVSRCLDQPMRLEAVARVLRGQLRLARRLPMPLLVSEKVCSVFANLLYWQASLHALGPERARRVMGTATRLQDDGK